MSQQNVELLRSALDTNNEKGPEAIFALIDPDFVAVIPSSLSVEPDSYRGVDGMRRYFELWSEVMDEVRFLAEEFIDAGEKVVVPSRVVARSRETGLELEQRVVQVWTIRDGRALSVEAYPTKVEALARSGSTRRPDYPDRELKSREGSTTRTGHSSPGRARRMIAELRVDG
jgi:ketosteroid isomerase-like protein